MRSVPFYLLSILYCLLFTVLAHGQLIRPAGKPVYVYWLTAAEARYLVDHAVQKADSSLFHDLIGSFPSLEDSLQWPTGHYLTAKAAGGRLEYSYIGIAPWHIALLENKKALTVQLTDKQTGVPLSAAQVYSGKKPLDYDDLTGTYRLHNYHRYKLLTVIHAGDTFYYTVTKAGLRRYEDDHAPATAWPVKYVLKPVIFAAKFPVDGIASWLSGKPAGSYLQLKDYLEDRQDRREERRAPSSRREMDKLYKGQLFFSKPKYREKDTIRFKAHVLDQRSRKWLSKPLRVYLDDDFCLGKITSARKGDGYDFSFVIHDSMHLRFDNQYEISLRDKKDRNIAWGEFDYEDYELKKVIFRIEFPHWKLNHIRGIPFEVKFTALDVNDLPVPDAKVNLYAISTGMSHVVPDSLFVPDTLWHFECMVDEGSKTVQVPDSIFPEADVTYELYAVMQNSEQERELGLAYIQYRHEEQKIAITLEQDSIAVRYNAVRPEGKARFYTQDRFDNTLQDTMVYLPFKTPMDNHVYRYFCETEKDDATLDMDDVQDGVAANVLRKPDSIFLNMANPANVPAVYHLYKGKNEIARGRHTDMPLSIRAANTDLYSIVLDYVWAGKTKAKWRHMPILTSVVSLNVQQPPVVYPGKETTISITALDYKGRPVKDMNLLAYAFTDKFKGYYDPYLPYTGKHFDYSRPSGLPLLKKDDEGNVKKESALYFPFWNKVMQLDTSSYYRFLFPRQKAPEYFSIAGDDSITQIAPFVVKDGGIEPVHYVMIDNIPVYFGFTDIRLPYSFPVEPGVHELKIRTKGRLATIRKFVAEPGRKTVFSVDPSVSMPEVTFEPYPDTLNQQELSSLSSLVMTVDVKAPYGAYAYLSSGSNKGAVIALNSGGNEVIHHKTVGPVVWKYWRYHSLDFFNVPFEYEPGQCYTFLPGVVKMKDYSNESAIISSARLPIPATDDRVLTAARFRALYMEALNNKRLTKMPPFMRHQDSGKASFFIEIDKTVSVPRPLNILLFRPDDYNFLQVYPGDTRSFDNLAEGKYTILLVAPNNVYRLSGPVTARANGENFYRVKRADTLKGAKIKVVDSLLLSMYKGTGNNGTYEPVMQQVMHAYVRTTRAGSLRTIAGVVSEEDGGPAIGCIIKIKGTRIGTVGDMDGHFTLDIPADIAHPELIVSSLDAEEQTIAVTGASFLRVRLKHMAGNQLSMVQIFGQRVDKQSYTGSISTIDGESSGVTTGNMQSALKAAAPGLILQQETIKNSPAVLIRGKGTYDAPDAPLIVINGAVYSGGPVLLALWDIASVAVLKDSAATGMYGAQAAQGVVMITIRKGATLPEQIRQGLESLPPMTDDLMVSGLRRNFRDDAYWQPHLRTDKNGKASFTVKYPDDITAWKTFVFATDAQHTGESIGVVKSYKPVSASLLMPLFFVKGDSACLLGKSLNYTPSTITATTTYYKNDTLLLEKNVSLEKYHNDTLLLVAGEKDSVRLKYMLTQSDGYFDGEEKTIPVLPQGAIVATGLFKALDQQDMSFDIQSLPGADSVTISATASLLDVVLDEITRVQDYKYLCNEQLASKIMTLLQRQKLSALMGKPFSKQEKAAVTAMINKLKQQQNQQNLWGWWPQGQTIPWISAHVLNALAAAKKMEYKVPDTDWPAALQSFLYRWESDTAYNDLYSLQLMQQAGIKADYEKYIGRIERAKNTGYGSRLALMRMRQELHLPYSIATLQAGMQKDVMGNIFWKDTAANVYDNEILTTLTAWHILEADSSLPVDKQKIVNWLLQQRGLQGWTNTYESALIVNAIAQYIPLQDTAGLRPRISLSGSRTEEIAQFPYRKTWPAGALKSGRKQGVLPVYLSWYQLHRDTVSREDGNFRVRSSFRSGEETVERLQAGKPVTLRVAVDVHKSAQYVMIEIPVPAGCSYDNKRQAYYGQEVYRQYFSDHVSIFCEHIPAGSYTFSVDLLPRYTGHYTLNPAKAELMYFPVFYGQEQMKKISIK